MDLRDWYMELKDIQIKLYPETTLVSIWESP